MVKAASTLGVTCVMLTTQTVVVMSLALAAVIFVVGTCAQGRLSHALLWILGVVPRERPSLSSRIPRREHYWSVIGRLADDAPEESSEPGA